MKIPSHETLGIIERTNQDNRTCDINKVIVCTSPKLGIEAGKLSPKNDRDSQRLFQVKRTLHDLGHLAAGWTMCMPCWHTSLEHWDQVVEEEL